MAAGPQPAAAAETVVTDLRVGLHDKRTRVVLDLSGRVEFRIFTLADPYRVVIDLPEVGWRLPARPLPRRTGLLDKLRYGLFKPGQTRVVLDVVGPAVIDKSFLMMPSEKRPYRLVVDLVPASRQAVLAQSKDRAALTPPKALPRQAPQLAAPTPLTVPEPKPKPVPEKKSEKRVVVLDPGHGGVDPGATGRSGIYEKHVTLAAARAIKKELEATGRYRVVLTRNRDIFLSLGSRVEKAHEASAQLFISVHADTIKNRNIRGLSVYTLSEKASDAVAEELATNENKADLIAGVDLSHESPEVTDILIDLAQRETMNQSARFAAALVKELRRNAKLLRNSHRFAGFVVLKSPDVPAVLLELGFLSNRKDEKALRTKTFRAKVAIAVRRAADAYFARVEEVSRH